jgi:hypothetical protein
MIFVECKPDITLVRSITDIRRKNIIHEFRGKGWICLQLQNHWRHCAAMLDEDPYSPQPHYIREVRPIKSYPELGLKLLFHPPRRNYIIIIRPRLEEWILETATETGIKMSRYQLPDEGERLHRKINMNLDKFVELLYDLRESDRLKKLKELLERYGR